jgi:hypothetical protein
MRISFFCTFQGRDSETNGSKLQADRIRVGEEYLRGENRSTNELSPPVGMDEANEIFHRTV